jgi:hypothetical protein
MTAAGLALAGRAAAAQDDGCPPGRRTGGQLVEVARAHAKCHKSPMVQLSLLFSEFATTEEAEAHDRWLRAKVQASLADGRPTVPHDEVMAEARRIIEAAARTKTPE